MWKRLALPALLTVAALVAGPGAASDAADPRHPWGADREALSGEGDTIIETPGRRTLHAQWRGLPVTVNQRFDDGGLYQVRYFNRAAHADPQAFVRDFRRLRRELEAAYGEPERVVRDWRSERLREQTDMEGMALAGGKLSLLVAWETATARVVMTLRREHMALAHQVVVTDPAHQAPETRP
ncbi:MAG: hypothetical protein R6V11_03665 [Ectothiorhodospiraceae bacterium]